VQKATSNCNKTYCDVNSKKGPTTGAFGPLLFFGTMVKGVAERFSTEEPVDFVLVVGGQNFLFTIRNDGTNLSMLLMFSDLDCMIIQKCPYFMKVCT